MAVMKIWPVRGKVDSPLAYASNEEKTANPRWDKTSLENLTDVMHYAADYDKTEKQFFVTGINCNSDTARDQFVNIKKQFGKEDGIVAYHAYQSFAEGEVTPKLAHQIGVEFAKKVWGDEYQVVVATHLNTSHLHNHFVINSISFKHGRRLRAKQWYELNKINDDICREHGLSIVENPKGKGLPYNLYKIEQNGGNTRLNVARKAVDEAISVSSNMKEFEIALKSMGYTTNFDPKTKYWTIKGMGWKKVMRLERLGPEYSTENIRKRIVEPGENKSFAVFQKTVYMKRQYRMPTRLNRILRVTGLQGLYYHYCYLLGYFPKYTQRPAKVSPYLKDDLTKLDMLSEEMRLLSRENINTVEELTGFTEKRKFMIEARTELRNDLRNKLRRNIPEEEKEDVKKDISSLTEELRGLRKDMKLAENIQARQITMKENIENAERSERKTERQK